MKGELFVKFFKTNHLMWTVIFIMTIFVLPSAVFADAPVVNYAALGDSLADGMTPERGFGESYVDFIADRIEEEGYQVNLNNYGLYGYTTSDVLKQLIFSDSVKKEVASADVITIDIGANDIIRTMTFDENSGTVTFDPIEVQQAAEVACNNVGLIIGAIKNLNSNANVYLMGYYNPFPYLPEEMQAGIEELMLGFNNGLHGATVQMGAIFVPTADAIEEKYTKFLPNPQNIHLSLDGYKAVAKEFWKVMRLELPTV